MITEAKTDEAVNGVKAALTPKIGRAPKPEDYVSTGSALINLAVSGKVDGGFAKGQCVLFVGDSSSGKTYISNVVFAEAARNPNFDYHRFIYDGPEDGAKMDLALHFGARAAARIEPPRAGGPSRFIEEFYDHVDDAHEAGEPFIYVLDSLDALTSESEVKKSKANKRARRKQRGGDDEDGDAGKIKGSMTDGKAKANSTGIRQLLHKLQDTGSILVMLNQTRDNLNPLTAQWQPRIRSGGNAPVFFADVQIWSSILFPLFQTYKGNRVKVGNLCRFEAKRTRLTGWEFSVEVPIYPSAGVDDVGACIRYLVQWGHWKGTLPGKTLGNVEAPELKFAGTPEKLAQLISLGRHEGKLHALVQKVWDDVLAKCTLKRRRQYE
jgi:RecA/RadA recombinase